jgi:uncharacterized membrane protein
MKIKIQRLSNFIKTTIIGGLAAILPIAVLVFVIKWVFNTVYKITNPIASLFDTYGIETIVVNIIVFLCMLAVFFFIGVLVKTRLGKFIDNELEDKYIMKIPGYKIIKDIISQFFGDNKSFFNEVVLVQPFNNEVWQTGFITDKIEDDLWTVFVPTGPNPTSGMVYHVNNSRIRKINATIDEGMKTIISCGSGTSKLLSK